MPRKEENEADGSFDRDAGCDRAGPVGIESIDVGIELSRWFATETQRVYETIGVTTNGTHGDSDRHYDRFAEWIASRGGSATEREIRRGPQRYRGENGPDHCETDCNALIQAGRAKWETGRRTRQIVLIALGDTGDGDTSSENTGNPSEVSPEGDSSVARGSATPVEADCDTCSENTAEIKEVSPSPVSPYPDPREQASERVKATIGHPIARARRGSAVPITGKLPSPPPKRPQGVPFHLVLMIHREQRAEVKRTRAATRTLCTTRGSP